MKETNTYEVFTTPITSNDVEISFDIRFLVICVTMLIFTATFVFFAIKRAKETPIHDESVKDIVVFTVFFIFFIFIPVCILHFNSEYKDAAPQSHFYQHVSLKKDNLTAWENNKQEIVDNAKDKLNSDTFDLDDACGSYDGNITPGPCGGDIDSPLTINNDGDTKKDFYTNRNF